MAEMRTELQMIKMSEIQSQEVAWLWFPFIPYGKLTIVQGDPGDGKTTLVLNIAAKLSKGEGLDSEMKLTEPLNVIYQSAEDGLADTVKPRLEAAGGQLMDWNFELRGAQSWICDEDRWDYRDIQVQMPNKEYTFHV